MHSPEKLNREIKSANEFQTIIKTMKGLAAVNIYHYENAVSALRHYHQTLRLGIQIFSIHYPLKDFEKIENPRLGIIIFGSDHGMCGRFNEQIADALVQDIDVSRHQTIHILALGARMEMVLTERQCELQSLLPMPASLDAITLTVQNIVLFIEQWQRSHIVDRILVLYNQPTHGNSYCQSIQQLFPPLGLNELQALTQKSWHSHCYPQIFLSRDRLFSALFHQYIFITLYQACAESLISENISRLSSMQIAQKNVSEHLNDLQQSYQQQRQALITEELLDILSGFEASKSN